MTTLREQIAAKIGSYLSTIKVSNGYRTDIGNTVIYYYGAVDQGIEHIVYADTDEKYEQDNTVRESELNIDVQVVRYGFNYGQLINETIADVIKALDTHRSLELRNVLIEPSSVDSDVDVTGRDFVVIQLKFKVTYLTDI